MIERDVRRADLKVVAGIVLGWALLMVVIVTGAMALRGV